MLKKCFALLACLAILIGCISLGVNAQSEKDRVISEIYRIYRQIQYATGRSDLTGFCGLMASYQLYYLGVNTYPIVYDGKDQYDAYVNMERTTGGNLVKAYSAKEYNLWEALNEISNGGTKNVYNILVGFQWTNTEAGRIYGHAMVINAIIDGVVYYSEGFDTPFDRVVGGPSICTIDQFASIYNNWALFEGLIVFGRKDQTDFCQEYSCNAFVQARQKTDTWEVPSTQESAPLRTVKKGERLEVTALLKNENAEYFYRIADSGNTAYVKAADVTVLSLRYDDVRLEDATYPEVLRPGENFTVNGILRSTNNRVHNVMVRILDELGREQGCFPVPVDGHYKNLKNTALKYEIDFQHLPYGNYTLEVSAEVENHYVLGGGLFTETEKCILAEEAFAVGYEAAPAARTVATETIPNGWQFADGAWRYYENGKYRTGWFCSGGVDYYLLEDGSAATGWQEINGKMRFFTDTGAMRTGWLNDNGAVYYLLSNGIPATGERTIDGEAHMFGTEGILVNPALWKK